MNTAPKRGRPFKGGRIVLPFSQVAGILASEFGLCLRPATEMEARLISVRHVKDIVLAQTFGAEYCDMEIEIIMTIIRDAWDCYALIIDDDEFDKTYNVRTGVGCPFTEQQRLEIIKKWDQKNTVVVQLVTSGE
jgi:hypothetical protein